MSAKLDGWSQSRKVSIIKEPGLYRLLSVWILFCAFLYQQTNKTVILPQGLNFIVYSCDKERL